MNQGQPLPEKNQMIRVMQIIAGALMFGVVVFGAVAVVLSLGKQPDPQRTPMVAYIGAGFTVIALMPFAVVPGLIEKTGIAKLDRNNLSAVDQQLCAVYQTKMIAGMAILEGAAFFNIVAYMSQLQIWSLAIAGGLVAVMAAMFPTRTRIEQWLETQKQNLEMG